MRGDPPDGEVLVDAAAAAADDDALELLRALAVALDHPHADPHGVAHAELRQIRFELPLLDLVQDLLRHVASLLYTQRAGGTRIAASPTSHPINSNRAGL